MKPGFKWLKPQILEPCIGPERPYPDSFGAYELVQFSRTSLCRKKSKLAVRDYKFKGQRCSMETHAVPLANGDGTYSQLTITRDVTKSNVVDVAAGFSWMQQISTLITMLLDLYF